MAVDPLHIFAGRFPTRLFPLRRFLPHTGNDLTRLPADADARHMDAGSQRAAEKQQD